MDVIEYIKDTKLQNWVAIILLFSTVLLQCADYHIDKFNSSLNKNKIEASNYLQIDTIYQIKAGIGTYVQFLPFDKLNEETRKSLIYSQKLFHQFQPNPSDDKLITQLEKGDIDLNTYFGKVTNEYNIKSLKQKHLYQRKVKEINEQEKSGTKWNPIKKFLLPLQILCVLILGFFKYNNERGR